MTLSILFFVSILFTPWDLIQNVQYTKVDQTITVTWEVMGDPSSIAIFEGNSLIGVMPPDTTSHTFTTSNYGNYDVVIMWILSPYIFDIEIMTVELGRLSWEPPTPDGLEDGYYVYAWDHLPDPGEYITAVSFDVGDVLEVGLKDLFTAGIIQKDQDQWFTATAYCVEGSTGNIMVSAHAGPVGPARYTDNIFTLIPVGRPSNFSLRE